MFQNVIFGWFARRALELGGLFGTLFMIYQGLPLSTQDAIQRLFTGGWENVTLGALVPLVVAIWGYVWSFRSTVRPQVVTAEKRQIPLKPDSVAQTKVEVIAKSADQPKTLWDRLTGK